MRCNYISKWRRGYGKSIGNYPDLVKYKDCQNIEGPIISINIKDIFMIKYSNGKKLLLKDLKLIQNKKFEDFKEVFSILVFVVVAIVFTLLVAIFQYQ